ncbi:MAG: orotate phosphoribosyltransferase [Bacteroidota bacterium]
MAASSSTAASPDLSRLGQRLYHKALVRYQNEPIVDPRGNPIGWLLDTRSAMLESDIFQDVGQVLAGKLRERGVHQIAGYGYGAFPMVCSVLSGNESDGFRGGFVREERKPHGRRRLVEGPLERMQPVVLLDDILNSGRSAVKALSLLRGDGYRVVGLFTLFNFTWGGGRARMEQEGLWVDSLLDLNLREQAQSGDRARSKAE